MYLEHFPLPSREHHQRGMLKVGHLGLKSTPTWAARVAGNRFNTLHHRGHIMNRISFLISCSLNSLMVGGENGERARGEGRRNPLPKKLYQGNNNKNIYNNNNSYISSKKIEKFKRLIFEEDI